MEILTLVALVLFVGVVVTWFMLPGSSVSEAASKHVEAVQPADAAQLASGQPTI